MDFLYEIADYFNSFDADGEPAPPADVYIPQWCICENRDVEIYSEQIAAWVCCDCGGIIRDDMDVDEMSK